MAFTKDKSVEKRGVGSLLIGQLKELVTHPRMEAKTVWNMVTLPGPEWMWEKEFYEQISPVTKKEFRLHAFEKYPKVYRECTGRIASLIGGRAEDWYNAQYYFGDVFNNLIVQRPAILYLDLCGGFYPAGYYRLEAFLDECKGSCKYLAITLNESWRHKGHPDSHRPEFEEFHAVAARLEAQGMDKSQVMRTMFLNLIRKYYPGFQEVFHCRYRNEGSNDTMNTMAVNLSGAPLANVYFEDRASLSSDKIPALLMPSVRKAVYDLIATGASGVEVMRQTKITANQLAGYRAAKTRASEKQTTVVKKDNAAAQQLIEEVAKTIPIEKVMARMTVIKKDDPLLKSFGPAFGTAMFSEADSIFHIRSFYSHEQLKEDGWLEPVEGHPGMVQLSRMYIEEVGIPKADQELARITRIRR